MKWFQPQYLKEGPGIAKDAPPKKGLALFFEIFIREFWQLLKLNLMFAVCSLPLVTFGAARAAMARCTVNMARDLPNDVWYDFRAELKKNIQRNIEVGLAELFCVGSIAMLLSSTAVRENGIFSGILYAVMQITLMIFGYLWPMLTTVDVPFRAAMKNAVVLPFLCLGHSLPAACVVFSFLVASWKMLPFSIPLILVLPFGFCSFVMSFAAWSDIRRLVIVTHGSDNWRKI